MMPINLINDFGFLSVVVLLVLERYYLFAKFVLM